MSGPASVGADLLHDLALAASDAISYADGLGPGSFADLPRTDRTAYRALRDALGEIGRLVRQLPREMKDRHPTARWGTLTMLSQSAGQSHSRDGMAILWAIVHEDVPRLLVAVRQEIEDLPPPGRGYLS